MRRLLIVLVACICGGPAVSYCEDEAHAARARAWTSGPFHFEVTRWSKGSRTRSCGEIVPGIAQRERSCTAVADTERETAWIGDRKWERDSAGWRGPYSTIWTHQDRMPAPLTSFSAGQVTCFGRVVIDGRAMNKYEFAKQVADRVWVETIFTDEHSGLPVRFETRGRSDGDSGSIATYRHDSAIHIDPLAIDLDKRWSESLRRLSQEAQTGDSACRAAFFAAVERGKKTAFEFEIKGSFESGLGVVGTFAPSDAIQYQLTSFLGGPSGGTIVAGGRAWAQNWREVWRETPQKLDFATKVIMALFPQSAYVGRVTCLGNVSVDGRDHDAFEYDFYRDAESARRLYSHRSMIVEKASGVPFRNVSVSRTHAHQWIETRRYDPTLTIEIPPPVPSPPQIKGIIQAPVDTPWPPRDLYLPPFVLTPPSGAPWPSHNPP